MASDKGKNNKRYMIIDHQYGPHEIDPSFEILKNDTYRNSSFSLINNSTAPRFEKIIDITTKNSTPSL